MSEREEEIVARALYAANSWWRIAAENDDGKGRYRDDGGCKLRAIDWDDLDDSDREILLKDAAVSLTACRPLILEEAAKVADRLAEELGRLKGSGDRRVQIGSHLETCATIAASIRSLSTQGERR